jgi:hypothetical protein
MPTHPTTSIFCPYCTARVQASVLAEREYPADIDTDASKYQFLECSQCRNVILGRAEMEEDGEFGAGWGYPNRKWPLPDAERLTCSLTALRLEWCSLPDAARHRHAN